ncbi:MAG: SURF1 family protein [Actinomycetota bacterium]
MYRFALRGRWLVGTVLVLVVAAVCVRLGFWQLDRLDQRRERNALVAARAAEEGGTLPVDPDEALYRRVTVSGMYESDDEIIQGGRALGGRPGEHVLTPLAIDGGEVVLVNRGWLPNSGARSDRAPADASPPAGAVTVTGVVLPSTEERFPVVIRLERQDPAQRGELPVALGGEPVDLGEGPHLSYAVQWFLFATVALVGWPVLLWRTARTRSRQ